ncbi:MULTISPECIES: gamma-butyrobetaine hydroxylase-like domain-containing protein [Corallincola]|uniref:DUF971 domain-containing protein n=3 Tax=Corallincola TaxID=1775176 RepID=A0A368N6E6_9GAMM|nr:MULTISPECIES: DUF971 domain-containing protein [Corallincola]RCU45124.1 DUF971 domain-containing protein [Corallincola holothuriorum]TAA46830.1 DUF971 domain-containing protein [Corallincola spongiicola]TCI04476.1 DUF971 domain-containing protein [Corallincola luteus]
MAGPQLTGITLNRAERLLTVRFDDGEAYAIPCELLRVSSPSAEVHGHGKPVLVSHKREVNIKAIERVGNYAVKLIFDDGHDTGIYPWQLLYILGRDQSKIWQDYLQRLAAQKGSREPLIPVQVKFSD